MNRVPGHIKSDFTRFFIVENGLRQNEFEAWAFRPGMLFGATGKWWGERGRRLSPHEGIDFCLYSSDGRIVPVGEAARVPVMYDGVVVRIIDDFLGRTVIVAHTPSSVGGSRFFSLYGHTVPRPGIEIGQTVPAGAVIATVAGTEKSRSGMEAHLHVSLGRTTGQISLDELEWTNMRDALVLFDPLDVIEGPFLVLAEGGD